MESQESGFSDLDIRVNAGFLRDPSRIRMSAEANMALLALQATAIGLKRDGIVYHEEYTPDGNWPGIPFVNHETLAELERGNLLERIDDGGSVVGVRVTWRWQSTVAEREQRLDRNRKRQQAWRDRHKESATSGGSRSSCTADEPESVTRYGGVTNGVVGEDRTGEDREGEDQDRQGYPRMAASSEWVSPSDVSWPRVPPRQAPVDLRYA